MDSYARFNNFRKYFSNIFFAFSKIVFVFSLLTTTWTLADSPIVFLEPIVSILKKLLKLNQGNRLYEGWKGGEWTMKKGRGGRERVGKEKIVPKLYQNCTKIVSRLFLKFSPLLSQNSTEK
jgi:hypothetical protein